MRDEVTESPAPRTATGATEPAMYSIRLFCESHNISAASLYRLWSRGEGPARVKVGTRTMIPREAAEAWRRSLLAAAAEDRG